MFQLVVRHAGVGSATEVVWLDAASEVLATIPVLLEKHRDCERIDVLHRNTRLFTVDCKGNRIA